MSLLRTLAVTIFLMSVAFAQQSASEYEIKAAYLYRFANSIKWPERSLPAQANLVICVFGGDDEFPKVLRDTLSGKSVNEHTVEIRRSRAADELRFCQLAFLRGAERNVGGLVSLLESEGVLAVGENKQFIDQGGMISLELVNGKVSYEINSAALERAGLQYEGRTSAGSGTVSAPAAVTIAQTQAFTSGVSQVETESARAVKTRVAPEYPEIAAKMRISGVVQVQAVVRADGTVKEVNVIGGHPMLADAAVRAVMKWRFEPGARETTESMRFTFGQ